MTSIYEMNENSPGFEKQKPWWFRIDGERVHWRPVAPFLFAEDESGSRWIEAIEKMLQMVAAETVFSRYTPSGYFRVTPTGPNLPATLSNSLMVLYLLNMVIPVEPGEGFDDEDYEGPETAGEAQNDDYVVEFSTNAPKLVDIYGPSHDEDGNQIIY